VKAGEAARRAAFELVEQQTRQQSMTRNLVSTGDGTALILTRDLKEHLGITDTVDVQIEEGCIVLRKPLRFEEAAARSDRKFANAYKELAK
ncbi:MAG: hypothetical protein H0U79_05760, partial [Solirubrobacterales bacterium]|nr:hypothetical protein [Solirubrobacterales bacterium]